ncbi:MAG: arginine decarboxylase, pyruvoyl-dependent [Elusimicrobia bacterium]|nr:arginine decarboxylase, pyruvoyl-dependent [Elusimicrobiota bacterium]
MARDVARYICLTKGVGRHRERLASFEEALRDAKIAHYNLVHVSSIFPPNCKILPVSKGILRLRPGQIVHVVLARSETNESHRLIAASIGLAIPKDHGQFGYLSEHHSFGETEEQAGEYAEDLAASMLASTVGVDFDKEASWDEQREIWKISGKIVKTTNVTQSAIGAANKWTSVVAAAVLVF